MKEIREDLFLTKKQHEVLSFIIDFKDENGYFPTMRQIGEARSIGIPTVQDYLRQLQIKGAIEKIPRLSRAYKIL